MKTKITKTYPGETTKVSFGILDNKGREIGASIIIAAVTVTDALEEDRCYYLNFDAPGDFIGVRITATRDGFQYGACQKTDYFKSSDEAQSAIEKRLEGMRKRYAKMFAA